MQAHDVNIFEICDIARAAGREIMSVYDSDFDFQTKGDGSPLTLADQKAHELIEASLKQLSPKIPVLSEESIDEYREQRLTWSRYWLVDPLDGTKEFIKRNGEFTVNIALIDQGVSVLGVVYAPVIDTIYYASIGDSAYKQLGAEAPSRISTKAFDAKNAVIVASRSHMSDEVKQFQTNLARQVDEVSLISMGSSLKLCLVAEGRADYYPRLGLTSEWDTAAAQCIVEVAGGSVLDCEGHRLAYSKQAILNPWFLVSADPRVARDCRGLE